jgi:hypothetical protein
MAAALLVFTPLQGDCLFVCALSILISMDVTPLLRRRLYGLQSTRLALAFAQVGLPLLVGSTVRLLASPLLLRVLCRLPFDRQPSHPTYKSFALTILW